MARRRQVRHTPRRVGPPPFPDRAIGDWLGACRTAGAEMTAAVDVGPGRAPGALEGVAAPRNPRGRDRRGGRGRVGRCPPHRTGGAGRVVAARVPTAALLANDPAFGPAPDGPRSRSSRASARPTRSSSASRPACSARRDSGTRARRCSRSTPASIPILAGSLVAGRLPDPDRADEIVVDENTRDRFDLDIGSTMVARSRGATGEEIPPQFEPVDGATSFRERMKVVGIAKSMSSELAWTPSSGFYAKYGSHMPSLVNEFVDLRDGEAPASPAFNQQVNRIIGHPVNVEDTYELYGIRKALNVTDFERDGLLLFALAALIGGGVLVGQALVRAVSASAADLPTWRAMGADRPLALRRARRSRRSSPRSSARSPRSSVADRVLSRFPTRHRTRLRPRPRDPRRLAGARRRRGNGARGGAGRRRDRRRGGG